MNQFIRVLFILLFISCSHFSSMKYFSIYRDKEYDYKFDNQRLWLNKLNRFDYWCDLDSIYGFYFGSWKILGSDTLHLHVKYEYQGAGVHYTERVRLENDIFIKFFIRNDSLFPIDQFQDKIQILVLDTIR